MKKAIFILLFVLAPFCFAQNYNLTDLKSVKLQIIDEYGALDMQTKQHLLSEAAYKLRSAGIVINEINPVAALQFRIDLNNTNIFVEPRVLLRLELLEKVQTFRSSSIRTDAKTYSYASLQSFPRNNLNNKIFVFFTDRLLIDFINKWLEDNPKK